MANLVTPALDRHAAQELLAVVRREAERARSATSRRRLQDAAQALRSALAQCDRCHGQHLVANPAWKGLAAWLTTYVAESLDDYDPDHEAHDAALMAEFERRHGPALMPCPVCSPAKAEREKVAA